MKIDRRRTGAAFALSLSAISLIAASVLGNVMLALVGSVALLTALVAIERYPRPRDW